MRSYDLIVPGSGSGKILFAPEPARLQAAIVEPGRFGAAGLNRSYIPSKMLGAAADAACAVDESARASTLGWARSTGRRFAIGCSTAVIRCMSVRSRTGENPASMSIPRRGAWSHRAGCRWEWEPRSSAASRPSLLFVYGLMCRALPGPTEVPYRTSDTIMRADEGPRSMLIVGGGSIAAEPSRVFVSFGAAVSSVQRGPRLLMAKDDDISRRFTELAGARFDLHANAQVNSEAKSGTGVAVTVGGQHGPRTACPPQAEPARAGSCTPAHDDPFVRGLRHPSPRLRQASNACRGTCRVVLPARRISPCPLPAFPWRGLRARRVPPVAGAVHRGQLRHAHNRLARDGDMTTGDDLGRRTQGGRHA